MNFEDLEKHLTYDSKIQSSKLKSYLFKTGLKNKVCEVCKFDEWMNKPIPLELHHCDGNNKNNKIWNLQILCPNCHSQTDNFRSKNKDSIKTIKRVKDEEMIEAIKSSYTKREALIKCGLSAYGGTYNRINKVIKKYSVEFLVKEKKEKKRKPKKRKDPNCNVKKYIPLCKIKWPDKEGLEQMISSKSILSIGKELGVSDNAIRRRAKKYGIDIRSVSKWSKRHGDNQQDYKYT